MGGNSTHVVAACVSDSIIILVSLFAHFTQVVIFFPLTTHDVTMGALITVRHSRLFVCLFLFLVR
jgi:hypothetical protein